MQFVKNDPAIRHGSTGEPRNAPVPLHNHYVAEPGHPRPEETCVPTVTRPPIHMDTQAAREQTMQGTPPSKNL